MATSSSFRAKTFLRYFHGHKEVMHTCRKTLGITMPYPPLSFYNAFKFFQELSCLDSYIIPVLLLGCKDGRRFKHVYLFTDGKLHREHQ